MITPLLASDFEGVELVMTLPVFALAAVGGLAAVWLRARGLAIFCGIVCLLLAGFSILAATAEKWAVARINYAVGAVCIGVGMGFIVCQRRPKGEV